MTATITSSRRILSSFTSKASSCIANSAGNKQQRVVDFSCSRFQSATHPCPLAATHSRNSSSSSRLLIPGSFVHRRGDHPYGSREYLLVRPAPAAAAAENVGGDATSILAAGPDGSSSMQILASLKAHRNIVFGAAVFVNHHNNSGTADDDEDDDGCSVLDQCPDLLRAALDDCSNDGEQPQAVSTLHGLSAHVRAALRGDAESAYLKTLSSSLLRTESSQSSTTSGSSGSSSRPDDDETKAEAEASVVLQAVTAIATGVPRPGHSVVGQGTYRDGAAGWEALAKEFVALQQQQLQQRMARKERAVTSSPSPSPSDTIISECQLYQAAGAELVQIELLADTKPEYLASAGGAMARFFFM